MRQQTKPISYFPIILGTGLAGVGTRIATLTLQEKNYNNLKTDRNEDTQCLEKSISHLEHNVDPLTEAVLQKR